MRNVALEKFIWWYCALHLRQFCLFPNPFPRTLNTINPHTFYFQSTLEMHVGVVWRGRFSRASFHGCFITIIYEECCAAW
uniref:Uncharacterized protein n=1 Tax=Physcomitrium patens TaxID=3218 RepID=A0A2K1IAD6_PHYPA|nr:hypothetical protein PHYPA_030816 [Physcomitrium patens]